jgi:hypothetical protein
MSTLNYRSERSWKLLLPALSICLALSISSCAQAPDSLNEGAAPTETVLVQTTAPQATQTPARAKVLYVQAGGVNEQSAPGVLATLEKLIAQADLELVEQEAIPGETELNTYRILFLFSPEQAALDMVQQTTSAPIVIIGSPPINPEDAWVIGDFQAAREQAAFLAGYIAALLTSDWRIGVVASTSGAGEPDLHAAFVQGGQYFCGLCRPAYPPYFVYPVSIPIDPSSQQGMLNGLAEAKEKTLKMILLDEDSASRISELSLDQPYQFLGLASPPENLRSSWIATIRPAPELALEAYWPMILEGAPGEQIRAPIVIEDVNPSLLSQGKMSLVEEIRDDLVAGFILPIGIGE